MGEIINLPLGRHLEPTAVNGKVAPPRRRKNAETRTREHLTPLRTTWLTGPILRENAQRHAALDIDEARCLQRLHDRSRW